MMELNSELEFNWIWRKLGNRAIHISGIFWELPVRTLETWIGGKDGKNITVNVFCISYTPTSNSGALKSIFVLAFLTNEKVS